MPDRTCSVTGCDSPARRRGWCTKHYSRWYSHGDPEFTHAVKTQTPRTYVDVYTPGHVLARKSGQVYEHRLVLFDAIGYGPHLCHWCDTPVGWQTNLQVDHINACKHDNRDENLVPSCGGCNLARGQVPRRAAIRDVGGYRGPRRWEERLGDVLLGRATAP